MFSNFKDKIYHQMKGQICRISCCEANICCDDEYYVYGLVKCDTVQFSRLVPLLHRVLDADSRAIYRDTWHHISEDHTTHMHSGTRTART
jgi:hypothetical protein